MEDFTKEELKEFEQEIKDERNREFVQDYDDEEPEIEEEEETESFPIMFEDELIGHCKITTSGDYMAKLKAGKIVLLPEIQEHLKTHTLKLLSFHAVPNTITRVNGYPEVEDNFMDF